MVGDPAAAEDVAAEALTRAYVAWRRLRGAAWRDGWVLKTTANLALRARQRRSLDASPAVLGESADALLTRMELAGALRSLPRRQRETVVLHFLGDLTEAEVAATLDVSVGTVKTHIHRGMEALRQRLGEEARHVLP